jgi:hypothetical protein
MFVSPRKLQSLLLFAIVFAFVFFHVFTIDLEDYWADEIGSYEVAKLPTAGAIWEHLKYFDTHPPLYFLSLHAFLQLADPKNINMRWLSVFWALVAMLGFYLWMQWSFGKAASLLALLLLTVNPFWLAYCQELRMYTMYPGFLWWGAAVLIVAVRSGKKLWFVISALLNSLALWTHYHAAFFIAAEVVALLVFAFRTKQESLRRPLLFFVCCMVLFSLPLVGLIISQSMTRMGNIAWLPTPKWYGLFSSFVTYYFIFSAASVPARGLELLRYAVPLFLIMVVWVLCAQKKQRTSPLHTNSASFNSFPLVLLIATALLPVSLMFVLSFSPVKFFLPGKYDILSLAPFLGLVAILLLKINRQFLRNAFIVCFLFLEGLAVWPLVASREKPNWKRLTAIIDETVRNHDVLVFPPQHWGNAYSFYSLEHHHFTTFQNLLYKGSDKPTAFYHLIYNYSAEEDLFYPWLTVQFMNQLWRHSVLFADAWYTFIRYEDVDVGVLRRWYLQKGVWEREKILKLNPVAFTSAAELATMKGSKHFAPLQIDGNQEVYCWIHSPPVPIRLEGAFSEGEYVLRLKAGVGLLPKSQPYRVAVNVDGREVGRWNLEAEGVIILVAKFNQSRPAKAIEVTVDGDWFRPAEFYPNNPDRRKLLAHFYWIAVTKAELRGTQK